MRWFDPCPRSPNPAEVTNPIKDTQRANHWVFILNVRRWFINANPAGYVIGVFNHEIGVHVLPYLQKLEENINAELHSNVLPHDKEALTSKEKGGIDDHQRAMAEGSTHFNDYFNLALGSANALHEASKEQESVDVLFAYLMDLAAMEPSGDKGLLVLKTILPNPLRPQTFAYVLQRYNDLFAKLPKDWQDRMPKMKIEDVEKAFLDYRAQIPKTRATLFAIGVILLVLLVIWIIKSLCGS